MDESGGMSKALSINGFALCKNRHWAMDRNLIASAADHHWHLSKILDSRRSNGEKELLDLPGKTTFTSPG